MTAPADESAPAHAHWSVRAAALLIAAAVAIHAGSLFTGLHLDDHIYTRLIRANLDGDEVPGQWYELAGRRHDGAAGIAAYVRAGTLPWWTDPNASWAMLRPVAVVTHYLDMLLWPDTPLLMHAQNLLWQALLLCSLWWVYRRLAGNPAVALVALGLCGFAARNGDAVGWLAARNTIMMAAFGALALGLHDRARRDGWTRGHGLSAASLLLSLWSSEGGVGLWGALLAYAMWIDRDGLRRGLLGLWPLLTVTVGWQIHYRLLGFGAKGGDMYLDPIADPLAFSAAVPARMGWMAQELLGVPHSALQVLPVPVGSWPGIALSATTLAVLLWMARNQPLLRFWLAAGAVAMLPLCAGPPGDRLLLWPGACACGALGVAAVQLWRLRPRARWAGRALVTAWVAVHIVVGAAVIPSRNPLRMEFDAALMGLVDTLPPQRKGQPPIIMLNTPHTMLTMFALIIGSDDPFGDGHHYILGASERPVVATRVHPHTLRLRPEGGYLLEPSSRAYRGADRPLRRGQHFPLGDAHLVVEEVDPSGRPLSILYSWPKYVQLEDVPVRWMVTVAGAKHMEAIDVVLPPLGQSKMLPTVAPLAAGPPAGN